MSDKITWQVVYKDFKTKYPRRQKEVVYWCPHDYATILLYFEDGSKWTYNYVEGRLRPLPDKWINEKGVSDEED